jgi:glycine/D-amino acid oxidase-like deaminating enzyme
VDPPLIPAQPDNSPTISFWQAALGPAPSRPPLGGDTTADVCVVGGGYTGLWTAWALAQAAPSLRMVVVEAEQVGFGASGRNGGWLSGLLPGDRDRMARQHPSGRAGVMALQRHLIGAVGGVVAACAEEGIDADLVAGGTLSVATNQAQLARVRAALADDRRWGLDEADVCQLGPGETAARLAVSGAVGSTFSPHCARVQPAKLVRGLADAVERRGVRIYERTRALSLEVGAVRTGHGVVRAPWVVRATEGYTAGLPGLHRRLLPMNSSMIITNPLSPDAWAQIGWAGGETWRDSAHAYAYLQRTADGRVAIGGRGVPYRYGSRLARSGDIPASTVAALSSTLGRLLPAAAGAGVAAGWSGVLGVARDWCPSVGVHRSSDGGGLAWAGGYVGDGVTTSHLAGLTLADLILGRDTSRTALPWVGHASRTWEPEPFRWLGVQGIYALYRAADRDESRRPDRARSSALAAVADRISGRP